MEFLPEGDVCPHAFDEGSFKVPRHNDLVCQQECAYCCQTTQHEGGIFVCAKCFVGCCPAHIEKHMQLNPAHTTYVRIEETVLYPEKKPVITEHSQIGQAPPKDVKVRCYCGECGCCYKLEPEFQVAASASVTAIINHDAPTGDAQAAAAAAWGADPPCEHCSSALKQIANEKYSATSKEKPDEKAKCSTCDHAKNNWMCMTCGNIGCPRKEAGGSEHGIFHFMSTGHPTVVKLGTVTPTRADIHCYPCCREVSNYAELNDHLAYFGIKMQTAVKTSKSLAEMELDASAKFEFDLITEGDQKLTPVFGEGLTGLKNFGNTCYIASILQVLAVTKPFAASMLRGNHIETCQRAQPLNCLDCQATRLFQGMASGRYSVGPPEKVSEDSSSSQEEKKQEEEKGEGEGEEKTKSQKEKQQDEDEEEEEEENTGENYREKHLREDRNCIAPKLWKQLIAGGNKEWLSKDQQDADEYFGRVMETLRSQMKMHVQEGSGAEEEKEINPGQLFEFLQEDRRTCKSCGAARYSYSREQSIPMFLPVTPPPPLDPNAKLSPEEMEARRVVCDFSQMTERYLEVNEYEARCSHCKEKGVMTEQHAIATFPDFLAIKARREFYDRNTGNIRKMDAKVVMPEVLDMSPFQAQGFQKEKETWLTQEISSNKPAVAIAASSSSSSTAASGTGSSVKVSEEAVQLMVSMSFDEMKSRWALFKSNNDPDSAINYMFEHENEPTEADLALLVGADSSSSTSPTPAKEEQAKQEQQQQQQGEDAEAPKLDSPVYPDKTQVGTNGSPAKYELYALVSHMGQHAHTGHWIAHVKHPKHGWVIFNDERVAISKKPPFCMATMYFYKRVVQ